VRNEADDDRATIQDGDLVLLIVENDLAFARLLLDAARAKGFKGLVTSMGAGALTFANQFQIAAITLDMYLPDMDGWRVLDRLKQDFIARHIPVCVISTDDSKERAFKGGALAFLEKPIQSKDLLDGMLDKLRSFVSRKQRNLLVAMKDTGARNEFLALLEGEDINPVVVKGADKFLEALDESQFDCVVLDDAFGKLDTAQVRQALGGQATLGPLPLLLYRTGAAEAGRFAWHSDDRVTVRDCTACSTCTTARCWRCTRASAACPSRAQLLEDTVSSAKPLAGKRVLIVDDDMRNIFALATVLEEHSMDIVWADNGREAISRVANDPQIEVVLMDIMMPEMDGMATMKEIRKLPQGKNLPMIAVTAKAMKGDREKCIEAGAWDYLSKPVNTHDLLTVLRAWLHQ
jgi:CheY-like chemotaxis protein